VNGPLQKRTNVLDLDYSRATEFPEDYETDLEFEWSNPSKKYSFFLINIPRLPTLLQYSRFPGYATPEMSIAAAAAFFSRTLKKCMNLIEF
jgi:hypothetical protein